MKGRVLIAAGSDSGGGAGIQADIKAVTALGAYAATAVTALTAQNTEGVHGIETVAPDFITQQIAVVLDDIGADALKTGMLHDAATIHAVLAAFGAHAPDVPLIADPVMVAKGGASLLDESAVETLKAELLPRAWLLTPNLPEAEVLLGRSIDNAGDMADAAIALRAMGPRAVLLKGGHLAGHRVVDVLAGPGGVRHFENRRLDTPHTHGTGCTLASAIAAGVAQGMDLGDAVARARAYVLKAIETAPGLGRGHGPLNHAHTVADFSGR